MLSEFYCPGTMDYGCKDEARRPYHNVIAFAVPARFPSALALRLPSPQIRGKKYSLAPHVRGKECRIV